jgi:glycosyltransferase involved in cell wall biosynthesis
MGVSIPETEQIQRRKDGIFTIICPANLVPKKGLRYLIEACRLVADEGIKFKCLIAGDGPLENELKSLVTSLKLESYVKFLGRVQHDRLIGMYENSEVDLVALPSIITQDGEKEGIPVALMEAMAHGIPVISTNTGGIPELLRDAGIVIHEKDSNAIARAIEVLMNDSSFYKELQKLGKNKIKREFNLSINVSLLLEKIKGGK